ncbi:phage tail protein [Hahella sp. CR1]|uniref:phage tail protein n=1 Tax=Hahella sp. CR1 TaxID=2992807 RepID=UPI00244330B2|nr:phage tail protein [Hahella sp. CR1]MDG9666720.1 phage tail protein [Hahella sp. CR1]
MPVITLAGERLIAQKQAAGAPLTIDGFVLANVPGLDPVAPIDRNEGLPDASHQVFSGGVTQVGYVNPNLVVYSLILDSTQGDFAFNWIGLISTADDNAVVAIAHVPLQQKRKTQGGVTGNAITRNFMLEFNGAQSLTDITVSADTWQIDFTARLLGIDERERLSNQDFYGAATFIQDGFKVVHAGGRFALQPGVGYVGGVRIELTEPLAVTVTARPASIWVDAALVGDVSGVEARLQVIVAEQAEGGPDANGVRHYVAKLADIAIDGVITDLRPLAVAAIKDALKAHKVNSDPHPQYLTDGQGRSVAGEVAKSALTAHQADADPHAQYLDTDRGKKVAAQVVQGFMGAHMAQADPHPNYLRKEQFTTLISGRKNLLINPYFSVWQSGPTVVSPTHGTYLADGWKLHRVNKFNGELNAHLLDNKLGMALTCTAASTRNGLVSVSQFVEASTLHPITSLGKTSMVKAVFKVRFCANYTGKLSVAVHNRDASLLLGWKSSPITGGATFPFQEVEVAFEFGDYHLSPERTGVGVIVSVHVEDDTHCGFAAKANNQLRLHAMQLELGETSSEFEPISLHEALAQCQRYYRAVTIPYLQGWTTDEERFTVGSLWYPTMRVPPAVSLLDLSCTGGIFARAEGITDKNCYITLQPNGSGHTAIRQGRAILDARF